MYFIFHKNLSSVCLEVKVKGERWILLDEVNFENKLSKRAANINKM